jgi:methionyl-tRNA formyltransferase
VEGNGVSEAFPSRPRIVFLGTPEFAVPTLKTLLDEGYEILCVVTQPDRPRGRGQKLTPPPVKIFAQERQFKVLQTEKLDERFLEGLLSLHPDLLVVVAFGQIIPGKVLSAAQWGAINIHASLLPKYRGSAPIQWALINNERETGLTTMFMDEGLDTGPILMQERVPILEGETAGELHNRLASLAPGLLVKTLQGLVSGAVVARKQDEALASYIPKLKKEQGLIDWSWPAERICGLIRGLDPWPGAFTYCEGKILKLYKCLVSEEGETSSTPGRVRGLTEKGLKIETGKGAIIVEEAQVPGKKRLPFREFMKGSKLQPATILGK